MRFDGANYEKPENVVDVSGVLGDQASIFTNLKHDVLVTTSDKVELALRRTLPLYTSASTLIGALGVFIALVGVLVTAEFKNFMGVEPSTWRALFMGGAFASAAWLAFELRRWFKRADIDDLVTAIRKEAQ